VGGEGGDAGTAGSAGGGQGTAFEPEGIVRENAGDASSSLDLVAFTLVQASGSQAFSPEMPAAGEPAWYVAVYNGSAYTYCNVNVSADFLDGAGNVLATTTGTGDLSAPMHSPMTSITLPCLSSYDTGMGVATTGLAGLDVGQVAKIKYTVAGTQTSNPNKLYSVNVQNVTFAQSAGETRAKGQVLSMVPTPRYDPSVTIYAVDPAGRPYGVMKASATLTLSYGTPWDFETGPFLGDVQDFVGYVAYVVP
jgi:hypothetical protein